MPPTLQQVSTWRGERCFLAFLTPADDDDNDDEDEGEPSASGKEGGTGKSEEEAVLREYADVFPDALPPGVPPDRGHPHRIVLEPNHKPPNLPTYRMSPLELDELRRQLKDLHEHEFIRPSSSPYGAPVLFVSKKEGTMRMCSDYRGLNSLTRRDAYPLPRIDELLDRLTGAKVFTKLDLRSDFWQIPIAPEDIHKTAFKTRYGQFEYTVMPFGLTNAPTTFQALMNRVIQPYIDEFVVVYLDDILIYSRSHQEHGGHVRLVLDNLRKAKLYAKRSKCLFFKDEVEFCGFYVSAAGLHVGADKTRAVAAWPQPRSVKEVRGFLGFCNYYRRFLEGFSAVAAPLTELTKGALGTQKFRWDSAQEAAFQALKHALTHAPILLNPDTTKPFILYTDASEQALGAVLLQDQGDGLKPCAYESKKLKDAELNYTISEKEAYALVHACRKFRCYLHSKISFTVRTDNSPLLFLQTKPTLTGRQARWLGKLAQFKYTIEHKAGKINMADGLSRRPDLLATLQVTELLTGVMTRIAAGYP